MLRSKQEGPPTPRAASSVRPRQEQLSVRRIDTEVEFLMALKAQLQAGSKSAGASKDRAAAATVAAAVDRSQRLLNAHCNEFEGPRPRPRGRGRARGAPPPGGRFRRPVEQQELWGNSVD